MSTTIDEKIVGMRFDNDQFESGVQETLSTIDKLKNSLRFDGVSKGFNSISSAIDSVSFDGLTSAVDTVKDRFSALGTFVGRIIENIADDAYFAGKRMAASLSTDQITAGWSKYGDKTSSVQTIMAATAKNFTDTGEQMEYVNAQLEKLNWFTDETSYNFLEMVNNIGKFTNNNIKLDDAVTSMEGISTWAALAGANSQEASRAMYNLSQSIGAGSVKLIDWKSIENANMATAEFKETVMQTAVEMGLLSKNFEILKPVGKYNGDSVVDVANFSQTLSAGWFTSDVLTATLKKYGAFTDQLYEASEAFGDQYDTVSALLKDLDKYSEGTLDLSEILKNTGMTAEEVTGIFDKLTSSEMELGKKGFKAAQEAKTFQEAINATKDAVSTGWMNTFELIFGNYEEAKKLWTDFANKLYDIFASGAEARNELLAGWKEQGGRDLLIEGISKSWQGFENIIVAVKEAFRDVFPPMTSERLVAITKAFNSMSSKFVEFSEMVAPYVQRAVTGLFTGWKLLGNIILAVAKGFAPLTKNIKDIGVTIFGAAVYLGDFIVKLSNAAEEAGIFEKITSRVSAAVSILSDFLSNFVGNTIVSFIEGGEGLSGVLEVLFDTLANLTRMIFDMASALTGVDLSKTRDRVVSAIQTIRNVVVDNCIEIIDFVKTIPSILEPIFNKITSMGIGDFASAVKTKVLGMLAAVKEAFEGFKGIDMSGVDAFSDKVKTRFEPLLKLFDGVKKIFKGIADFFKKLIPLFGILASKLGEALGGIGEAISDSVHNSDFNTLFDIVNGGILAAIGIGISKFIKNISNIVKSASGLFGQLESTFGKIKEILDGVKGCFEAWQQDLKAKILLKIATAIAILTASLVVLSLIDSDKLSVSLAAITTEFIELLTAMKIFTSMVDGKKVTSIAKIGTMMIAMSVAVLILSSAMKKLSAIDWNGISKGIVGISSLSAILVLSAKELSKSSGHLIKGSAGLIAFALAIRTLVKPVKELGEIDTAKLAAGLISVGVLCVELAAFLKIADFDKSGVLKGVGLMAVAEAVNIIAKACAKFAEMDTKALAVGISAIGAVLLELAAFTVLTGDSKHVIATATGMVILGAALNILAGSVSKFGSMDFATLQQGIIGMAFALAEIALAMRAMPATAPIIATGLVLVGAALNVISSAIKSMGSMAAEDLSQGLIALGSSLAVIALGLYAMKGSAGGAAALLIFAGALAILTPCLKALGNMKMASIVKSLVALAGTFAVLGVAGHALASVTPTILALSAAVALLGAGALGLAAGLTLLTAAGTAGIAVLELAAAALINLIPLAIKKVGEGLISLVELIGDYSETIKQSFVQIILSLIGSLEETVVPLVDTVLGILDKLLESLSDRFPSILESIVSMCMDILGAIRDNIGEITDIVLDILVDVLEGIANKLPDLIQAGIDIVISLIDGLAEGIENNAQRMRDAFVHLFESMLEAILVLLGIHSPSEVFSEIGVNLILGLIQGIRSMLSALLKLIGELVLSLLKAIKNKLVDFYEKGKEILSYLISGIASKIVEIKDKIAEVITGCINTIKNKLIYFFTKGKEIITNIKDGITDKTHELVEKAGNVISSVIDAIKGAFEDFKKIGSYLIDGLKEGISDAASDVVDSAKGVVSDAVDAVADFLGINSPSRLFAEFGRQTDAGYIVGLNAYSDKVSEASENIGKDAVNGISSAISVIADTLDSDLDYEPTIRPILDINDVVNGVGSINNMLASKRALNLSADADLTMNSAVSTKNQNGIMVDNKDVISEISALRSDLSSLTSVIGNLKIVMDTGELVGSLTNPLDISLGRRMMYEGRGI